MTGPLNIQICVEFLDGTASLALIPVWLKSSKQLLTQKPGTMEEVSVVYTKTTRTGIPIYREYPVATVLRFPHERVRKTSMN